MTKIINNTFQNVIEYIQKNNIKKDYDWSKLKSIKLKEDKDGKWFK